MANSSHSVNRFTLLLSFLFIVWLPKDNAWGKSDIELVSLNPGSTISTGSQFQNFNAHGKIIPFNNQLDYEQLFKSDYRPTLNGSIGGGMAVGDLDNDGQVDLFFASKSGADSLYMQVEPLKFQDKSLEAGISQSNAHSIGAAFVDIEGDGDLDIYVTRYGSANKLYINDGYARFSERAAEYGLDYRGSSVSASFADYDRDGDLDLYLVTNRLFIPQQKLQQIMKEIQLLMANNEENFEIPEKYREIIYFLKYKDKSGALVMKAIKAGQKDILFRNDGEGKFVDVTDTAGITSYYRGHQSLWWDFNKDGHQDLYVSNDYFDPDQLFKNNGDGTFTEVTKSLPCIPWFSMGCSVADINNDGFEDLLGADMLGTSHYKKKLNMGDMSSASWFLTTSEPRQYMRNVLLLNQGKGLFNEVAHLSGLSGTDWTWSVLFGDLDCDGLDDVFFTNGFIRNIMNSDLLMSTAGSVNNYKEFGKQLISKPVLNEQNLVYKNSGNLHFSNTTKKWGIEHLGVSTGGVLADIDGDGDLDILSNNINEPASLFLNTNEENSTLVVNLRHHSKNVFGVGTSVTIHSADKQQTKIVNPYKGYASSAEPVAYFGLGKNKIVSKLTIAWPDGTIENFNNIPVNSKVTIRSNGHSSNPEIITQNTEPPAPLFVEKSKNYKLDESHKASNFDDFTVQPLLPNQMSQLGSGLAIADINNDGFDDVFFGGGQGQAGQLYLNQNKIFKIIDGPWQKAALSQDSSPLWIDYDSDGDLDLFVASGGNHLPKNHKYYQDRLYENIGDLKFEDATELLPVMKESSGPAVAFDMDKDGDTDLFIGNRMTPWTYPITSRSYLLENRNGKFEDVTNSKAPEAYLAGMVTAATACDVDNDGLQDLIITTEWGSVKLFANFGGKFRDISKFINLSTFTGWWQSIHPFDADNDGDLDFLLGNFGHNTKYHASPNEPVSLYLGDFNRTGRFHIVEAEYEKGVLYPVRGRSCSSTVMPFLKSKFPTFDSFAKAPLFDIYDQAKNGQCQQLDVTHLETMIAINNGARGFEMIEGHHMAQLAPSFGANDIDINGDGFPEIILAQNFYGPQPETGRMDGSIGTVLSISKNANTIKQEPRDLLETGLVITGDAKGLATGDFNRDGNPDLLVSRNGQTPLLFEMNEHNPVGYLSVKLKGLPGNTTATGARIQAFYSDRTRLVKEVRSGTGYWSQSSSAQFFSQTQKRFVTSLIIKWPGFSKPTHQRIKSPSPSSRILTINHPKNN